MLNKIIKRGLLGFVYGIFIGQTILILESLFKGDGSFTAYSNYLASITSTEIGAVMLQYLVTGIIGITFASTTVIFETEKWSLVHQIVVHFLITSVVMYFSGFLCGWFPHTVTSTIIWFAVFIVVYVIMLISFTMYYKKKARELNEAIKK